MPPLERETGFEPATSTLARLHSTAELFPLIVFFVKIGALVKGEKDGFRFSVVKPLKTGVHHLSLGSGKEVEFPLTLTLSPIGGEGITKGAHNAPIFFSFPS